MVLYSTKSDHYLDLVSSDSNVREHVTRTQTDIYQSTRDFSCQLSGIGVMLLVVTRPSFDLRLCRQNDWVAVCASTSSCIPDNCMIPQFRCQLDDTHHEMADAGAKYGHC